MLVLFLPYVTSPARKRPDFSLDWLMLGPLNISRWSRQPWPQCASGIIFGGPRSNSNFTKWYRESQKVENRWSGLDPCAGRAAAADNLWAPPPPTFVDRRAAAADNLSARRRYHCCCGVTFWNFR